MRARLLLLAALVAAATAMVWTCGREGPTSGESETRTAERTVAPEALAPRSPPETGLAVAPRTIEPDRPPTPTSGRLVGTVVDEAGRPIEDFTVEHVKAGAEEGVLFRGDAVPVAHEGGRYAVSGDGGSPAHILLHAPGRTPAEWRGRFPSQGETVLPPVVLRVGATISGRVQGPSRFVRVARLDSIGSGSDTALSAWPLRGGRYSVRLTPAGPFTAECLVAVMEDGTFAATGLDEGPHAVFDYTHSLVNLDEILREAIWLTHPDVFDSRLKVVRAPATDVLLDVRTAQWSFSPTHDPSQAPPTLVTITSALGRAMFRSDRSPHVHLRVLPLQEYRLRFDEAGREPVEVVRWSPDTNESAEVVIPRSAPEGDRLGSTPRVDWIDWESTLHLALEESHGWDFVMPVRLTRPDGRDEPVVLAAPRIRGREEHAWIESFTPRLLTEHATVLRTPLEPGRYVLHILDRELQPATIPFDVPARGAGDGRIRVDIDVKLRPR